MKNDNQFVSNVVSKFAPNKEYYEYFRDLIKCYKEYYQRQMKDTVDTVVDIVFYHQNNSYQHHIVLCDEKWQYIVSPITATSSKKYERIIPLFDKNPYFNGYLLCNNGLFGLMNSDFEEIVPCLYESLIPYCFVKESNPYNNEVTMSTVALFCATKSDFSSEFITIDGYKVFEGYDCINPLKAELEYRYYEVDGILYHTVLEKLTSFIISYDWESPCFYEIDLPMYQECVYHIKEFEDKFKLHIDNLMLETSNIQEIPQCEVQISKAQNFGINVVALMNTKLEFETVSGMTVEEYLQSIFFENISGDMPIDALDLTVRSYNSLKRGGINTVYDLCNIQEEALLKIQNIGTHQKQELLLMRKKLCDALKSKSNDA